MESLFFNTGERHYRRERLSYRCGSVERVDISNGLLFFDLSLETPWQAQMFNHDRFVLMTLLLSGSYEFTDGRWSIAARKEGSFLYGVGPCRVTVKTGSGTRLFAVAVADFYLKRYLSLRPYDPIDYLYAGLRSGGGVSECDRAPLDALSHYYVDKITRKQRDDGPMAALRMEFAVTQLLLHRLGLMDLVDEAIDPETLRIARRAREVLMVRYMEAPTIPELAHLCTTNTTRLKRAFKRVYGQTLGGYVRTLRLRQANELLRERDLSIGEVARRVGFSHQGYFSRLFYETYGIHPKELRKFGS